MTNEITKNSHEFSFFQAVYLLEKHYRGESGGKFQHVGLEKYPADEPIRFSVSPELGFPRSDIRKIENIEQLDKNLTYLEVNFSGLHGSASPLPSSYTEKLAGREGEDNPVKDFFDFFHHRYLTFFYRIWKKYRYHILYESGAKDKLSNNLFHYVGLSNNIQSSDSLHLDWAKLLSYIGQLSTRTRSPKLVSGIVAHCFALNSVEIEEWVHRRISIPVMQRNKLGHRNCELGEDCHLGEQINDLAGKFAIKINDLNFVIYKEFLPGATGYNTLKELMKFILRDPLAWDLKLELKAEELPVNSLGKDKGNTLGQTFWLGNHQANKQEIIITGEV